MNQTTAPEAFKTRVRKSQSRFKKINNPDGPDTGVGEFFMQIDVTALTGAVHIPLSIASGKKPTGFVYQIEGTATGMISTASVSCKGEGVTQITFGTIRYAKIPTGKTAAFRILIEMRGRMQNAYSVTITTINYKHDQNATRYKKFEKGLHSAALRMK